MTANFLNAVICLYGNRYEEAIGYTDMVLGRRTCLEAMFIKGRALYELKRYDEAYDVTFQIVNISQEGEEKKAIDKKLLLFEARVNEHIGNPIAQFCKELFSLCPEFLSTYIMLRKVFQNSHIGIQYDKEEEHIELIEAFNDKSLSQQDFLKKTQECTDEKELKMLRRYLIKICKSCILKLKRLTEKNFS